MGAALSLVGGHVPATVRVEPDSLRSDLARVTPDELGDVRESSGTVTLDFFARGLTPDLLAIRISMPKGDQVTVFREKDSDATQAAN